MKLDMFQLGYVDYALLAFLFAWTVGVIVFARRSYKSSMKLLDEARDLMKFKPIDELSDGDACQRSGGIIGLVNGYPMVLQIHYRELDDYGAPIRKFECIRGRECSPTHFARFPAQGDA